jgi:hypothetical protein
MSARINGTNKDASILLSLARSEINADNLLEFTAKIRTFQAEGGNINTRLPGQADPVRPVHECDTLLDHYQRRFEYWAMLAGDAILQEDIGNGEAVFGKKAETCNRIITFLREHGGLSAAELATPRAPDSKTALNRLLLRVLYQPEKDRDRQNVFDQLQLHLDEGADINYRDQVGKTALDHCNESHAMCAKLEPLEQDGIALSIPSDLNYHQRRLFFEQLIKFLQARGAQTSDEISSRSNAFRSKGTPTIERQGDMPLVSR